MLSSQQQKEFVHSLRYRVALPINTPTVYKNSVNRHLIFSGVIKVLPLQVGIVSFQTPGCSLLEATHVTDVGPIS